MAPQGRRYYVSSRRQRLSRIVSHVATARVGYRAAGDQGIDSTPRHRRAGGLCRDPAVCRLVSADRLPRTRQAVLQLRPDDVHLSRPVNCALGKRFQPAERFQVEDDLHGGHQASPGRRHRPRPNPGLHVRRHGAAVDHGGLQRGFVWRMLDHTHEVKIDSLQNVYDANGKIVGKKGRTTTNQGHYHEVEIYPNGTGIAKSTNQHEHEITSTEAGRRDCLSRQRAERFAPRRVPQYGNRR